MPAIRNTCVTQDKVSTSGKKSSNQDTVHASGDGDCARCCRLCGGDTSLKYFRDTYVWEGVEQRYDQLLYDCFGVKVTPSDCMICEWCIRALRGTEKFRALVHAAFDHTASISDLVTGASSSAITLITNSCQTAANAKKQSPTPSKQPQLKKKPFDRAKGREAKKTWLPEMKSRRVNVQCELCKQRYPMMVPNGERKSFTCSRCKKHGEVKSAVCRKCNIVMPANMVKEHMELHVKAELRGKARPRQLKKQSTPSHTLNASKEKFQCTECPKKYSLASDLALHMRNTHQDTDDKLCAVCGEDLEIPENVEGSPYKAPDKCSGCKLLFKNQRAYSLTHNASTP